MSKYLPDFAGAFCLMIFLASLATKRDALFSDGDTFWHIKAGSIMLENQSLINSDTLSHTAFGTPWTAHEWLAEIIMASIHNVAGLEGLLCFFLLISSMAFWLLFKATEKWANQWVTLSCVALAFTFSQGHLSARPHLFTWLFMMITLSMLTTGGKKLYWLPVVTIVWANLHGGFILSLVLQIIFIVGIVIESHWGIKTPYPETLRQLKIPISVLLLSVLAVGLNPFGYELLLFPFQVSKGVFSVMINEWKAPNLQEMWSFRFYLVALVFLISFTKSTVTWTERLLIVFFLNAALTHIRHISLMLIALTPFTAKMINTHFDTWRLKRIEHEAGEHLQLSAKTGPLATIVVVLVLLISSYIDHRSLMFLTPKKMLNIEAEQLNQLVGYLDKNLPTGNMYNEYSLGGYLLYALTPPPKVFIDGRADMYGEKILSDYSSIVSSSSNRDNLLDQYGIDWVVFEVNSQLVKDLIQSGRWESTFRNTQYVVLVRHNEDTVL
ncbi:hypothetical protein P9J64_04440 [Deltaproteobacteria bacterium IMCC39524]|nr:hypothetical protein [Deltaproteobacteria bacterium IMCC39524]